MPRYPAAPLQFPGVHGGTPLRLLSSAIFRATPPSAMGTWRALTPFHAKLCLCHHAVSRQHAHRHLAKGKSWQVCALKLSHEDVRQVPHTAFRSGKLNKPYSILVHPSAMEPNRTSRGMAHSKYVSQDETVDKLQSFRARQHLKDSSFQFMLRLDRVLHNPERTSDHRETGQRAK